METALLSHGHFFGLRYTSKNAVIELPSPLWHINKEIVKVQSMVCWETPSWRIPRFRPFRIAGGESLCFLVGIAVATRPPFHSDHPCACSKIASRRAAFLIAFCL